MLRERGFKGAQRTLREYVAEVRPQPRREVYLRTETLPGEQAQIDWAYVGSRRHEQRSTIISTNLAFKQWGTVFPGAACVVALVDRFAQHCHRVDIDAESWREKHGFEPDDPPPAASRPRRRIKRR